MIKIIRTQIQKSYSLLRIPPIDWPVVKVVGVCGAGGDRSVGAGVIKGQEGAEASTVLAGQRHSPLPPSSSFSHRSSCSSSLHPPCVANPESQTHQGDGKHGQEYSQSSHAEVLIELLICIGHVRHSSLLTALSLQSVLSATQLVKFTTTRVAAPNTVTTSLQAKLIYGAFICIYLYTNNLLLEIRKNERTNI